MPHNLIAGKAAPLKIPWQVVTDVIYRKNEPAANFFEKSPHNRSSLGPFDPSNTCSTLTSKLDVKIQFTGRKIDPGLKIRRPSIGDHLSGLLCPISPPRAIIWSIDHVRSGESRFPERGRLSFYLSLVVSLNRTKRFGAASVTRRPNDSILENSRFSDARSTRKTISIVR